MKVTVLKFFLFITLLLIPRVYMIGSAPSSIATDRAWSRVYTVRANNTISKKITSTSPLYLMEKIAIPPFNQLIFSWNALRPLEGYFSFFVQVREQSTQKWGVWHHMYDWGANGVQRSHKGESDGMSYYEYVRLEMEPHRMADAFRVKVEFHDGAQADLLKSFAAAVSAYNLFKEENPAIYKYLHSVYLPAVPQIAQFALDHPHKDRVCSPVSLTMLLGALGNYGLQVEEVMKKSYDNGLNAYGSWPFNIAHAFECMGGDYYFFVCRLLNFAQIQHQLIKGIPVVVSVRGPLPGAERPYAHGHLLVIVGWDQEKQAVICHDPAFDDPQKTLKYYPIAPFLLAWERSRRLAYWAVKR